MSDDEAGLNWPDPTPEMLETPAFEAIWHAIKHWDINVPRVYEGYCGATGNHVRTILDALQPALAAARLEGAKEAEERPEWHELLRWAKVARGMFLDLERGIAPSRADFNAFERAINVADALSRQPREEG